MYRLLQVLFVPFVPVLVYSQALGTKKDISTSASVTTSTTGPIVQPMDLAQMLVALLIVGVLLKWLLPKAIARLGRKISTPIGSTITLEESASFGGGQLQIVTVRGKTLLLCVATTGVTCLADLSETEEQKQAKQPAFFDILDSADPANAVVTTSDEDEMSMDDAIALIKSTQTRLETVATNETPLDRLNRLTGSK